MNFYKLYNLLEDYEVLPPKKVSLNDPLGEIYHYYPYLVHHALPDDGGIITRIRDVITLTYDACKKGAWKEEATTFGYIKTLYMPHPPEDFDKLSDEGKRAVIYERALGSLRNFVVHLGWIISPGYDTEVSHWQRQGLDLPPEFIKWVKYMTDEMEHDDEIKGWEQRSDKEIKDVEAKRQAQYRRQQEMADVFGKALYKQRKKIEKINPSWAGLTEKEAQKIADDYVAANYYERGQYMDIIRKIAKESMGKMGSFKTYYMNDQETQNYLKSVEGKSVKTMTDDELVNVVNKTVGITNTQDIWGMDWGDVHPALSAGALGSAAGLRMQGANELKERLIKYRGNAQKIHRIYTGLDAENRKFFFKA